MKPLRILIYDTNFVPGISRFIPLTKIKGWQKSNCQITIVCTKEGESFYKKELKDVSFVRIPYTYNIKNAYSLPWEYIKITIFTLWQLPKLIRTFDVVYSQSSIIDFLFVPWLLRILDKKISWFVMVDNLVPSPSQRPGPFLKKFIPYIAFLVGNILLKKSDGIFVVTNFLKEYYVSRGYNVVKTSDGYGIDLPIFTGTIAKNTPTFTAIYTGRLHEAKGVFDLLEVIKRVVKKKPAFHFGILGDGEESVKQRLHEKVSEYHLGKNVSFTGYVSGKRKGDMLRNAGFFLFLSYDEGCPHAVIEAFAMNKLVLSYDLPIYNSVFKKYIKQKQLVTFPLNDYEKIASYIISLPKKPKKFTNKIQDYTWDTIIENELQVMRKGRRG